MKQTKISRLLSMLLCFVMVLSMLPMSSAFALGEDDAEVTGEDHAAQQGAEAAAPDPYIIIERGQARNAADIDMIIVEAAPGTEVIIEADPAQEGEEFDRWEVLEGGIALANETQVAAAFRMGTENVHIRARYRTIGIPINEENFPDPNFRKHLLYDCYEGRDGVLTPREIEGMTDLRARGKGITDLTGIGFLTGLHLLNVRDNQLTSLDLSQNTNLQTLMCERNQLSSLNVKQNSELLIIACDDNCLTELDITKNTKLQVVSFPNNQLTQLDPSHNPELEQIWGDNNHLAFVDGTSSTQLMDVICENNEHTIADRAPLSALGGFDKNRASNIAGGNFDGDKVNFESEKITYTYDCGHGLKQNFSLIPAPVYFININNGAAYSGNTKISTASPGVEITLAADAAPAGEVFDKWVVDFGAAVLKNETAETTTFVMPAGAVTISASYKPAPYIPVTAIYLNGQTGDDSLDGTTPEKALKTFERAKEMAIGNPQIEHIIVIGTTSVQGEVSLDGTNAVLLRGDTFGSYLLRVESGTEATLSRITVNGNADNNKNIEKSLVEVRNNSILTITEGAELIQNHIKDIDNTATMGGAIKATSATINMNGGIVEDNAAVYGGGIYLYRSTMNFQSGIVTGNTAKLAIDKSTSPRQYYSAGGGILADEGSTVNLSGDAQVVNNLADEIGGGISLGSNQWGATNILNMTGGTVSENAAGSAGGGIFVQAKYFSGGASKAYISGGRITNNAMDGHGITEKAFGGGGIYVNGAIKQYGGNGELYLTNVLITANQSNGQGAGIASCPVSEAKIHATNGGAIYGNQSTYSGNEFYILCNKYFGLHSGQPEYKLAKRMLGGVLYDWENDDGTLLDESKYEGILEKIMSTLHSIQTLRGMH